jgi:hypothetical protein
LASLIKGIFISKALSFDFIGGESELRPPEVLFIDSDGIKRLLPL